MATMIPDTASGGADRIHTRLPLPRLLLTADIGGTKADLAIVAAEPGGFRMLSTATLASRKHGGPLDLVGRFLREHAPPAPLVGACFSVAGPVVDGEVHVSNLGWTFTAEEVSAELGGAGVLLVNDLQATARAVPNLLPSQLLTLQEGRPQIGGMQAVIAPGTGLGEALLMPWSGEWLPLPSEGGHNDFGPADELQIELLAFLQQEFGQVSYERVCSGQGIANLYRFLVATGRAQEPASSAERIARSEDATPAIVEAGLAAAGDTASARALTLFASILGAEAGNLALRVMATGGVYIGGGLPPRLKSVLVGPQFLRAFRNKGPVSALMDRIPVRVILEPKAALFGAIAYAMALGAPERDGVPIGPQAVDRRAAPN